MLIFYYELQRLHPVGKFGRLYRSLPNSVGYIMDVIIIFRPDISTRYIVILMCDDVNSVVTHYKADLDISWLVVNLKIMRPDGAKLLFGLCSFQKRGYKS